MEFVRLPFVPEKAFISFSAQPFRVGEQDVSVASGSHTSREAGSKGLRRMD
jgi:hypothetical protein